MTRRRRLSLPWLLLYLAAAVVVLLALAQLLLPRIAESRIRSRLDRYGTVHSVHVSAWPAIELLWGDADSAKVQAGTLALSTARATTLLHEAKGISNISLQRRRRSSGPAAAYSCGSDQARRQAERRGPRERLGRPRGPARRESTLRLLGSENGRVMVRATGALFGFGASLDAVAEPSSGRLIVRPQPSMLGTLADHALLGPAGVRGRRFGEGCVEQSAQLPGGSHGAVALSAAPASAGGDPGHRSGQHARAYARVRGCVPAPLRPRRERPPGRRPWWRVRRASARPRAG